MKICNKYDSPAECTRSYSLFCKKDCEFREPEEEYIRPADREKK